MINCKEIQSRVKKYIQRFLQVNNTHNLRMAIFTSNDPASRSYLNARLALADEFGIIINIYYFEELGLDGFASTLLKISEEGIPFMVDRPCPPIAEDNAVITHTLNIERYLYKPTNTVNALSPVALAIQMILFSYNLLKDRTILIIGKSQVVGDSLARYLLKGDSTLMIVSKPVKNLSSYTLLADVIISATGQPHLIDDKMIKEDAYLIDVGTFFDENGNVKGDFSPKAYSKTVNYTPVPGGVGPLTTLCLFIKFLNVKYENLNFKDLFNTLASIRYL